MKNISEQAIDMLTICLFMLIIVVPLVIIGIVKSNNDTKVEMKKIEMGFIKLEK